MRRPVRILAATLLAVAGLQLAVPSTGAAAADVSVQLRASVKKVPYGKQLDLTATVHDGQPGSKVTFYASRAGATTSVGTAATDGQGKASITVQPTTSANYTATVVSEGVETPESAAVPVGVAPQLTVSPHKRIATVWVFSASAKPAVDGIRIQLQRLVGKKWTKVERAVTKQGVFEFTLSVPAGSSKWRLVSLASSSYAASVSKVQAVNA